MPSSSGLSAVDRQWGGLEAGGTYLLVGRAGAGRSALALQAVRATVEAGERCLLLSPRPPSELVEIGQSVAFDLAGAHRSGLLHPLRIPTAADIANQGADGLDTAYHDLRDLARSQSPTRIVVEDFTPLVQFDSFERLDEAFSELATDLRSLDVTLVVGLGAPANDASRQLLDVVRQSADGVIEIQDDGSLVLDPSAEAAEDDEDPFADDAPAPSGSLLSEIEFGESARAGVPDPFGVDELVGPAPTGDSPSAADADASTETDVDHPAPADTEDEDEGAAAEVQSVSPAPPDEAEQEAEPAAEVAEASGADASDREAEVAHHPAPPVEPTPLATGSEEPDADASDRAAVVTPPSVDPGILPPNDDPFGVDPADALMDQGYLADSSAAEAPAHTSPFSPPEPAVESDDDAFRRALATAFQTRSAGVPFLIVAARMQSGSPEAGSFSQVVTALRSALPDGAYLLSDDDRKRVIALLTMARPEAGQALFGGLQAGLRQTLGSDADGVLQAISAVTIPDAQPFTAPADLMAYAFEN